MPRALLIAFALIATLQPASADYWTRRNLNYAIGQMRMQAEYERAWRFYNNRIEGANVHHRKSWRRK